MEKRLTPAALLLGAVIAAGCGKSQPAADVPTPTPTIPLPTTGFAGRPVTVYPLTMLIAEEELGWSATLPPRAQALPIADSIVVAQLIERAPEVQWIAPDQLRRAARQAPGMLANPDQMGTAVLRHPSADRLPEPVFSQMRALTGIAGDRWALVPASLIYLATPEGAARAELTLVMADVRLGQVLFRTVARGTGTDPWSALRDALQGVLPVSP